MNRAQPPVIPANAPVIAAKAAIQGHSEGLEGALLPLSTT